jgi:tRNA 2-thiocytidine biosynthesis protein TtcA
MADRFLRRAAQTQGKAGEVVRKRTARAVLEQKLIADGDRILMAVSGGKDSTVMAWALSRLKQSLKKNYELAALHISTDFCACCKKSVLAEKLEGWDIPFTDLFVPVVGRLKPERKMNCYWCSTQRRTELLKYAVGNSFNKIALGHHMDDIIETFFMNLCTRGELSAMPVKIDYRKYPVTLIRPLAFLEERQIIACAEEQDILKAACTCPYGIHSQRREMREKIAALTGGSGAVKRRIIRALTN